MPRRQKNRQNHWLPGISVGSCLKSSSEPQWHQDLIPLLKINPEWRIWADGSGWCSCSRQLVDNGFPLGLLRAAQRPSLSLSIICLCLGSAFSQLVLGSWAPEPSYSLHLSGLYIVGWIVCIWGCYSLLIERDKACPCAPTITKVWECSTEKKNLSHQEGPTWHMRTGLSSGPSPAPNWWTEGWTQLPGLGTGCRLLKEV